MGLDGTTAVVTGGAQGLGAAIAAALHARGAHVVIGDVDADGARRTAQRLGSRAEGVALDVRDRDAFVALRDDLVDRHGGFEIVVNNAARTVARSFWEIEPDEWDDVMEVNLRGVLFGCQVLGAHLRDRGTGRIVNLASLAGQAGGLLTGAHYAASKAGIVVLTKIVAAELAGHGVTVNAVAPAAISGPAADAMPADRLAAAVERIPVGRLGTPVEVAETVAFLCGRDAGFITGATVDVNGGLMMR